MATENAPAAAGKTAKEKSLNKHTLAVVNSIAIAFSTFAGSLLILSSIAGFTKKWSFGVPYLDRVLDNAYASGISFALVTLALAIFGIVTVNKLTDLEGVKKTWCGIAKFFLFVAVMLAIEFVGTLLYSLLAVGNRYVNQGDLWLNGGLAQFLGAGAATGMFFLARAIAHGKVQIIRALSIVAISASSLSFVLTIIVICVNLYVK